MLEPLRTIRFAQTHRHTGLRRRFVIAQIDNGPGDIAPDVLTRTTASPAHSNSTWHYKVRIGDNGVWSAFRPISVPANATDEEIRTAAKRHMAGRIGDSSSEGLPKQ